MIAKLKSWLLPFLATLAVFLVACNSEQESQATPTESMDTVTNVPTTATSPPRVTVEPTRDPSPMATATATSQPTPSATLAPTHVPVPIIQFVDNEDCTDISRAPLPITDIQLSQGGNQVVINAEIASTQAEQSQGLMCRESITEGTGMLFPFESDRSGGFWMFNTYVPLDILYFGGESGDVAIRQMEPCPRQSDEETQVWSSRCGSSSAPYRPGITYSNALELPQGWLESQGFDLSNPTDIVISID